MYDLFGQSSRPYFDFDTYLADRESLRGEDIVAWVTIGKEHLPRTEDVPLITNFGTSFLLWPWNVFDKNADGLPAQRSLGLEHVLVVEALRIVVAQLG